MVITHEGGLRFDASIRGHRVLVDQPAPAGEDSAPMPIELLGAALGTCVALYVRKFCDARALPCEGLRVEVEQHTAPNPTRVQRFDVRVVLPSALPPHHAELIERVARSCPVHNTLAEYAEVVVGIELLEAAVA
jgi:putative redox protein